MPLEATEPVLTELTPSQQEAVTHAGGPLLIIAGAGTGKTTVITRRIAWLLSTQRARPEDVLALTFTDKASAEMQERVDLLVPYGYVEVAIKTFHAFGDQLLREHAAYVGLTPNFRVLSKAEQLVFLRQHIFDLPLTTLRPPHDPTRFVEALATVFSRAKDEAVDPQEFLAAELPDAKLKEVGETYAAYERLLRASDAVDFGDQVLLAIRLLEERPDILAAAQQRFRHIFVDEFQDTNYAQFRFLQLLAHTKANVTVVADDDQSIYKWRGAAVSNVLKFLDQYPDVRTVVLHENFRSTQPVLDSAYRLIRFNDPDRLEVRRGIDKRLVAVARPAGEPPQLHVFDTVSSEADWVARTIRGAVESGVRRPNDFAVLVRSNREADVFLRALNVAGVPWHFSGATGLFSRSEVKMLVSCLKTLADPDDSISWYHVASSPLYSCPMADLTKALAHARRSHASLRAALEPLAADPAHLAGLSEEGRAGLLQFLADVSRLLELSRVRSPGQVLYQWLADRGWLAKLGGSDSLEESAQLQTVARFFSQLRRMEDLVGPSLPELMQHLELFQAIGNEPFEQDDAWTERVSVLTLHKAKGLEFPVVFMVGLVHGRFPTPKRRDAIELPEALIKDILPQGDYHLQEERRLFYVGMTRAQDELHLSCAYDYGGKSARKVSRFVSEALELGTQTPAARVAGARELIDRSAAAGPLSPAARTATGRTLRLDPHGVDDYLTCPLKYRYSHVLRIPVLRHHLVIYGAALHEAVAQFFMRQLRGKPMTETELVSVFEGAWRSEGFLSREHEALRLAQGRQTLRRFYAQQQAAPERPLLIEEKFRFPLGPLLVVGRWDRVDRQDDGAVIIDYKSSDVREQDAADRRTRESLQLLVYALAWKTLHDELPLRVELRFLETGLTGRAEFTDDDLARAVGILQTAAAGIRSRNFQATPNEFACQWCAFQAICPVAFKTG